jgi:purine-binding chemotaxis protein CheW
MEVLTESISEVEEDTMNGKYLTFSIENEIFGIEIKYVMEIIGIQEITEMPEMPEYVKGIINLRGRIIPIIDVRLRFKKNSKDYDERTCVIVTNINESSVGFIVDSVADVITIMANNILDSPNINSKDRRGYVNKIGKVDKSVILLIECEKLLNDEEFNLIGMKMPQLEK